MLILLLFSKRGWNNISMDIEERRIPQDDADDGVWLMIELWHLMQPRRWQTLIALFVGGRTRRSLAKHLAHDTPLYWPKMMFKPQNELQGVSPGYVLDEDVVVKN